MHKLTELPPRVTVFPVIITFLDWIWAHQVSSPTSCVRPGFPPHSRHTAQYVWLTACTRWPHSHSCSQPSLLSSNERLKLKQHKTRSHIRSCWSVSVGHKHNFKSCVGRYLSCSAPRSSNTSLAISFNSISSKQWSIQHNSESSLKRHHHHISNSNRKLCYSCRKFSFLVSCPCTLLNSHVVFVFDRHVCCFLQTRDFTQSSKCSFYLW